MPNANTGEAATKNNNFAALLCNRDCNELYLHPLMSIHWRASLVPAAAVIPAPRAYINVVAVKKPVVGFESIRQWNCPGSSWITAPHSDGVLFYAGMALC